ncbi:MAG: hypothetical protein OEX82_08930 [Nitrosomonas sp.]|nr:hypothetical protein [Nitrosomonas sp.]
MPTQYGHREVLVKGYVDHVDICLGADIIARHARSYGREEFIYNPLHYLALLEQKPRALDQAAPLQNWVLPETFDRLRRLLEVRMERRGRKEYIQVLRLLENFSMEQVESAIKQAIGLGVVGFDAIKHLVLCAIERRPAKLDMTLYPYLPSASVGSTEPQSYLSLLQITKASQQSVFGGSI